MKESPYPINYRLLQPAEAKDYRSIRLESLQVFPNSFGSNYEEQKAKKQLGFEVYIKEQVEDKFIVGAFSTTDLVGICGFYRNENVQEQHKGAIIQMYVRPAYQGKKIGMGLLDATLKIAFQLEELEHINLGVFSNNEAAVHLYKKMDFTTYGVEKNCLKLEKTYVDLVLMVLDRDDYLQSDDSKVI